MPISSVGRTSSGTGRKARATQRGITLLEMIVVVSIIGLIVGVSYPSISAGSIVYG